KLLDNKNGDKAARAGAEELLRDARAIADQVQEWLNTNTSQRLECPKEVETNIPMWTASELLSVLKPLYPHAQNITNPNRLITLLHGVVRRVPNPNFIYRFSKDPN